MLTKVGVAFLSFADFALMNLSGEANLCNLGTEEVNEQVVTSPSTTLNHNYD